MNSSAPARGCRRPGYQRLDNQAASASRWSHRVRCFPPGSSLQSRSNFLPGRKRSPVTGEAFYSPPAKRRSVASEQSFDCFVKPERFIELKKLSDRFGKLYEGRAHGKFATEIKDYTTSCQRLLNLYEQTRLVPWLEAFKTPTHWSWRSLTTVFHSLTAAGAFTPQPFTDQAVTNAQATSLTGLLDAVRHQCQQQTNARGIDVQGLANLLWAVAKLIDNGRGLTLELQETVTVLLPHVVVLKDQFIPQHISNLLWAVAKLVDNSQALVTEFKGLWVVLLPRVHALKDQFNAWGITNLLWAMAKLLDNGQELTPELKETVAALLPHVSRLKDKFIAQGIANLLWAAAKLVDHGLELTPEFNRFLVALLPRVSTLKGQFIVQSVANLMWAMAKLVDNGYEWTQMLKEAVVSLLPFISTYKDQFIQQHIANLLWAMAKLVDNGQELTPEFKVAVAALLSSLRTYKEQFIPQHIANLLWAMGSLGDFVSTAATDSVVESMLRLSDKCLLFSRRELVMSLWGLLVCRVRLYLANNNSKQNDTLEYLIDRLFSYLENASIDNKQGKSVMALAASWLGRGCPVDPHYQTANSATQSVFKARLQSALPSLKIEQEKSLHSLPPVDLLLPEHRIAIEIQGPSHYVGRDFKTRNGSTLLKTALLRKAGYDVLEIPVNHLNHHDLVEAYIDQIQRKMIEMPADDGMRHVDVSCTDREFFSA